MANSIGMVFHFFNEELLMEGFCRHHRKLFDDVIAINHCSTDRSVEIINQECPEWVVVNTALDSFNAGANDREVEYWETQLSTDLKFALNVTEWVFDANFRQKCEQFQNAYGNGASDIRAMGLTSVCLVDEIESNSTNPMDHIYGYVDRQCVTRRPRFVHNADHGHYALGRHSVGLPAVMSDMLLLHWTFAPYPICRDRKLQIQTRIPQSDKDARLGWEHIQTKESLHEFYLQHLVRAGNLLTDPDYSARYQEYMIFK